MKKIKDLYYLIWSDLLLGYQKKKGLKSEKWYILFFMSFLFGLNYAPLIFLIPKSLFSINFLYEYFMIDIGFLNGIASGIVIFLLPGLCINYYLIFYHRKYESFTKEYGFHEFKYFGRYLTISTVIPIVLLFLLVF